MKRRVVISVITAVLFLMFMSPVQAASANSNDLSLVFNGQEVKVDVNPFIKDGRTMVPVRGIFEKLDLDVQWEKDKETVTIKDANKTIVMKLGDKEVTVNGNAVNIDAAVTMKEDRVFIPIRFVAENTGASVKWISAAKMVHIATEDYDEKTKEIIAKMGEVKYNSFSTNMNISQTMSGMGEQITMDMSLYMDMVLDPLGIYQEMNMTMKELGDEELTTKAYITQDGYYMYESTMDQWLKMDDDFTEELLNLTEYQTDPTAQFEMMEKYYQNVALVERGDEYVLYASVSGDGFQELLDEMLGTMPELDSADEALDMKMDIKQMDIVTVSDKATLYPKSGAMTSVMTMTMMGEEMSIAQDADFTYANFNSVEPIAVPQEVKDSAVSIE